MEYTNVYNLPDSLSYVLSNIRGEYDVDPNNLNYISATTLNLPPRIRLLKARHYKEIKRDVSEELWSLLGEATHMALGLLLKSKKDRYMIEQRLELDFDGVKVTGRFDVYDKEKGIIEDWKITSVWAYMFGKPEWEKQLNVYSYLLRKKLNIEPKKIRVIAILRDWKKSEMYRYHDYPEVPFGEMTFRLWFPSEQEKYIKSRIKVHQEAINLPDDELPLCTPEERWQRPNEWAVMKNKNKTALRKFYSKEEAVKYLEEKTRKDKKNKYRIVFREGVDRRCIEYCPVKEFCNYYKEKYGE